MSHSADQKQQNLQKYIDLYRLQQSSVASVLHSNLAQPVIAAKSFAAAISSIKSEDTNLKEAQKLASFILELTDQAYTVVYDLMRQNEVSISDFSHDSHKSMQSTIEQFGLLLRFDDLGIKLQIFENVSLISVDRFVQIVMTDWIKAILIFLSRQSGVSNITVRLIGNEHGLNLEVTANIIIDADQLETELVFVNICKQLDILSGSFSIRSSDKQCCMSLVIPFDCEMVSLNK